jgi:shikimate kinase / 3-dehydroquinate synthase
VSDRGAVILTGFMGAGKTTTARDLAALRGLRAHDADQLIEGRAGTTIAEIFARDGEAAFRALEETVVCELLDRVGPGDVVSMSGGAVGSAKIRAALTRHLVVLLEVDPKVAWRRAGGGRRPLARDRGAFEELHATRAASYAAVADAIIPARAREALPRAYDAVEQLRLAPSRARLLWAISGSAEYPVWLARGLLGSGVWPLRRPPSRRFCVTDENVARLWGAAVGEHDGTVVIAPGERSKTIAGAELVWSGLAGLGVTRADHVVALGGGVVGDLAGFCAATYQRGIPVVQVPTTLAAQVDSAYGGKTGIDLESAKNYVGAFHQPSGVLVDPQTLETLPAAELAAGYAEVLKTALIAGGTLWQRIAADAPVDEQVIFDCVRCKLAIVAADEHDDGRRQVLNLGHTVGHAIETATGYARYRHGEAVGLGLLAALELSGQRALREQVGELLARHGLPTRSEGVDPAAVIDASRRDKKRVGASVPFVLVDAPGAVRHGATVEPGELEAAVAALCR